MSGVFTLPSSSVTRCVTTSLFLNTTIWPWATVAGLGLNASFPPSPVIVMVTFVAVPVPPPPGDGVAGDVGVLPPPPPQLIAMKAPAIASARIPGCRMAVLQGERVRRWTKQARYQPGHGEIPGISAIFVEGGLRGPKPLTPAGGLSLVLPGDDAAAFLDVRE